MISKVDIKKTIYFVVALFVFLFVFLCLKPPKKPSKTRILQMQSEYQLRQISEWIFMYMNKHQGVPPKSFSDLFRDHDSTEVGSYLQVLNTDQFWKPSGWETNRFLVDIYSDYIICVNTNHCILAFERPGIWPDETVAICFTNLIPIKLYTTTETSTGKEEKVSEKYELQVERYSLPNFEKLLKTFENM